MSRERRREMADRQHPALSTARQRTLLGISRSCLYSGPAKPPNQAHARFRIHGGELIGPRVLPRGLSGIWCRFCRSEVLDILLGRRAPPDAVHDVTSESHVTAHIYSPESGARVKVLYVPAPASRVN